MPPRAKEEGGICGIKIMKVWHRTAYLCGSSIAKLKIMGRTEKMEEEASVWKHPPSKLIPPQDLIFSICVLGTLIGGKHGLCPHVGVHMVQCAA